MGWTKHSVQKVPSNFIPTYPKDNDKIFVIRTWRTWNEEEKQWMNVKITTEIKYLKKKSIIDDSLSSNDMMVVYVYYEGVIFEGEFQTRLVNVDYDINFLTPDKFYYVNVGEENHGYVYRPERKEIDNYVGESSTTEETKKPK